MATYTMYWPEWMCEAARGQGLDGQPVHLLWGGHNADSDFGRFKVGPGDTVVPVTSRDGVLYALASVHVTEKTNADAWLERHPGDARLRLHGCGGQVLAGTPGAPLRFDRALTPAQLEAWRYDAAKVPRALKHLTDGRLTRPLSVQGVYRVTTETAAVLDGVLGRPPPPAPAPNEATALAQRLRESPDDEGLARVLADAWQHVGDARGELLALELALRTETSAARAGEWEQRLAAAARKVKGVKQQPGGFPHRAQWGGRDFVELRAVRLPLADGSAAGALSLAQGVVDVEGFDALGMTSARAPAALEAALAACGASARGQVGFSRAWVRPAGEPFTVAQADACLAAAADTRLALWATGVVRLPGTRASVPLQSTALWLGAPPRSEVRLFPLQRLGELTLRVPLGSALGDGAATALEDALRRRGASVNRRVLRRTARGDVAVGA